MSRKLMVWTGALAFALALAAVRPADAGPWSIQVGGGLAIPTGDFADEDVVNAETGFQFGGAVDYRLNEMFAIGLDGSWNRNKFAGEGEVEDFGAGVTFTLDEDRFSTWQIGAHGKYFIPAGAAVTPYLLGGVGIYNTKEKWEGTLTDGIGGSEAQSGETNTDSRFGFKGGLGGVFKVNEMIGIGVEGNYNYITQDEDKVGVKSLEYIGVTGAIIFNLMQ